MHLRFVKHINYITKKTNKDLKTVKTFLGAAPFAISQTWIQISSHDWIMILGRIRWNQNQ